MTSRESLASNVGASTLTGVGPGARLEVVGHHIVRYGLVLVLMWIGAKGRCEVQRRQRRISGTRRY